MKHTLLAAIFAPILMSACTTTGNVERNAVIGAGIGAVAGAILDDDNKGRYDRRGRYRRGGSDNDGVLLGAVIGGAVGAYTGYLEDEAERRSVEGKAYRQGTSTEGNQDSRYEEGYDDGSYQSDRRRSVYSGRDYRSGKDYFDKSLNVYFYFDRPVGRYYYYNHRTRNTYWRNGKLRNRARGRY